MGIKKQFIRTILLILFFLQISLPLTPAHAQQLPTITGNGTLNTKTNYQITMTFPPAGGAVTGHGQIQYERLDCTVTCVMTLTGTFAGGDGGVVTGTWTAEASSACLTRPVTLSDSWSGVFNANGTGLGTLDIGDNSYTWQITYSAEEFAAGLPPAITAEYIYKTYGITVEDSFGDYQYERTSWTDKELVSLNNVLKKLPPALIKNMKIKRIIRNKVYIRYGSPNPYVNGVYNPCPDRQADPACEGSAATIRIFDNALNPSQVFADPTTKFEAVILHELIHAAQYNKDEYSIYNNVYNSPLVQNFVYASNKYASGPQESLPAGINVGWHWGQPPGNPPPPKWTLYSNPPENAPTDYAKTDPLEDMCDSAMLYMYDPQKLKNESPGRYEFLRDQVFEGVEYGSE